MQTLISIHTFCAIIPSNTNSDILRHFWLIHCADTHTHILITHLFNKYSLSSYYVMAISKPQGTCLKFKHVIYHDWVYCLGDDRSKEIEFDFIVAQIIHSSALTLLVQTHPGNAQFALSYPVGTCCILQKAYSVGSVLPGLPAHHAQLHLIILTKEVDFLLVLVAGVLFWARPGHQLEALYVLYHAGQLPIGPEAPWTERLLAKWAGGRLLRVWARDLTVTGEAATAEIVATVNGDWLPQGSLADGAVDLICQAGHRGDRSHDAAALWLPQGHSLCLDEKKGLGEQWGHTLTHPHVHTVRNRYILNTHWQRRGYTHTCMRTNTKARHHLHLWWPGLCCPLSKGTDTHPPMSGTEK